ncbi:MAG: HAD family hydrolase [Phycisphaerae bacterium]|nr:HAD family hydrolase [Phycisphaerae bacterium]
MSKPKPVVIAICYDFDGTLSPGNMQEYNYIPSLNIKPADFWSQAEQHAKDQDADAILAYMNLMLEKATRSSGVRVTRKAFVDYGEQVELFAGVPDWFDRITEYGKKNGAKVEHFIISSGIKEMIEGTKIARKFKKIYASSFMYDQHDVAYWPAHAINYTTKTQFLFRINKGLLDTWDNSKINSYVEKSKRPVPFTRMVYIGDGSTDIPCMKLVKDQGGYSIAVYKPSSRRKKSAEKLLKEDRVNFVASADYTEGSSIDLQVKAVITKMLAEHVVAKGPRTIKPKAQENDMSAIQAEEPKE